MPNRHPRRPLVVVTVFALTCLVALACAHPTLATTTWSRGDDLALVVAWAVAVATAGWLVLMTSGCLLALGCGRPLLARRLAPALPFGIRRIVEVAIVASSVALPALPASAAPPPRSAGPTVVADQPVVRAPAAPTTMSPATGIPAPLPAPAPTPAPTGRVVVRDGDNLWRIARAALARTTGASPRVDDVARYWRTVIAVNRTTLRSGDPSLIFPGEIVTLPPLTTVS